MESRTPPQNLDAEQSVLGSILLDNEVFATLEGTLRPDQFYKESHRKLYRAMERLFHRNEPIDLVTLTEELRQGNELDEVGNVPYLVGLVDSVPTAAYAESYARIVSEKAVLRDLIGAGGKILQAAYDQAMPLDEVLDASEKAIFELSSSKRTHAFGSMQDLVSDTFAHINELFSNPDPVSGLRTGFRELDQMTAGLQKASLNVLAARPSMGKCVTASTKIDLPGTGERITIEEFVRRRHGCVYGVADDGRLRPTRVSDWIDSGVKPAFRVTTRTGRVVETTGHHPFLAARGWTPLHDLGPGDSIAVPRAVPAFGDDEATSFERVRLMAQDASTRKRFPEPVWRFDRARTAAFLRTLFSCDGTIYGIGTERRPRIEFTVASEGLAQDVHHALVRFGIVAKLWRKTERSWRVEVTEPGSIRRFRTEIGFDGEKARRRFPEFLQATRGSNVGHAPNELWTLVREACSERGWSLSELARRAGESVGPDWNPHTNRGVPVRRLAAYAEALDHEDLRRAASSDLYWDRIETIEPLGPVQVYDLTVPDGANFVANDVCVHNTAFALTIAQNVALRENATVGLFSLEMSGIQLVTRMLCSEARVDMSRVRNGQLTDRDFQRLADTAGRMSEAKIFIDDNADLTVMELRSRARRLKAEHGIDLIVVDYLQLMSGGGSAGRYGAENRQQEISSISRGLKALARELDIPVLVLSQLSRAVESRPNKRPMLSDLRECVTGDTLVVRSDGTRVPIAELVGDAPCVTSVSAEGRLRPARAELVWEVGVRDVIEVRTASGRTIRCTPEHRLLGADGWVPAGTLGEGDRLAIVRRLPPPVRPERWEDDDVVRLAERSRTKGVPPETFRLANDQVKLFLRTIWPSADPHERDDAELAGTFATHDPATARDVAALLLRLGVVARIHSLPAEAGAQTRPTHQVLVPEGSDLAAATSDDLYWDRVTELRPAGREPVFDLTVPETASWLADGVVSHNSGAIEQDADLVMFIYRDEYYDPQSEKQGIAEILVGKQRNGPVGGIDLQFHNAHVRFNDLAKGSP